jgi:uncharacterized membrane protein YdjX (TVP38/TMEM64 family)
VADGAGAVSSGGVVGGTPGDDAAGEEEAPHWLKALSALLNPLLSRRHLLAPLFLCLLAIVGDNALLAEAPAYYRHLHSLIFGILAALRLWAWYRGGPRINKVVEYGICYGFAVTLLLILIRFVTKLVMFTDYYGFEYILTTYADDALPLFFLICFLQPIMLPVPEPVSILAGSAVFGALPTFLVCYPATVLGILVMYNAARYGGARLKSKYGRSKKLETYYAYVDKYGVWVLLSLLIFPVLPDEIICLGAGFSHLPAKGFLPVVLISKLVTSFCLAYFPELVEYLAELSFFFI